MSVAKLVKIVAIKLIHDGIEFVILLQAVWIVWKGLEFAQSGRGADIYCACSMVAVGTVGPIAARVLRVAFAQPVV